MQEGKERSGQEGCPKCVGKCAAHPFVSLCAILRLCLAALFIADDQAE